MPPPPPAGDRHVVALVPGMMRDGAAKVTAAPNRASIDTRRVWWVLVSLSSIPSVARADGAEGSAKLRRRHDRDQHCGQDPQRATALDLELQVAGRVQPERPPTEVSDRRSDSRFTSSG